MLQIYFGHPINAYDTDLELRLIRTISEFFPGWKIENPNQEHHAAGYKRYADSGKRGMQYYYYEVLPDCRIGIFLPFRDGKFGAGVFGEAKFFLERGYPIWQINADGVISKLDLSAVPVLSVEETRERIRTPDGKSKPY